MTLQLQKRVWTDASGKVHTVWVEIDEQGRVIATKEEGGRWKRTGVEPARPPPQKPQPGFGYIKEVELKGKEGRTVEKYEKGVLVKKTEYRYTGKPKTEKTEKEEVTRTPVVGKVVTYTKEGKPVVTKVKGEEVTRKTVVEAEPTKAAEPTKPEPSGAVIEPYKPPKGWRQRVGEKVAKFLIKAREKIVGKRDFVGEDVTIGLVKGATWGLLLPETPIHTKEAAVVSAEASLLTGELVVSPAVTKAVEFVAGKVSKATQIVRHELKTAKVTTGKTGLAEVRGKTVVSDIFGKKAYPVGAKYRFEAKTIETGEGIIMETRRVYPGKLPPVDIPISYHGKVTEGVINIGGEIIVKSPKGVTIEYVDVVKPVITLEKVKKTGLALETKEIVGKLKGVEIGRLRGEELAIEFIVKGDMTPKTTIVGGKLVEGRTMIAYEEIGKTVKGEIIPEGYLEIPEKIPYTRTVTMTTTDVNKLVRSLGETRVKLPKITVQAGPKVSTTELVAKTKEVSTSATIAAVTAEVTGKIAGAARTAEISCVAGAGAKKVMEVTTIIGAGKKLKIPEKFEIIPTKKRKPTSKPRITTEVITRQKEEVKEKVKTTPIITQARRPVHEELRDIIPEIKVGTMTKTDLKLEYVPKVKIGEVPIVTPPTPPPPPPPSREIRIPPPVPIPIRRRKVKAALPRVTARKPRVRKKKKKEKRTFLAVPDIFAVGRWQVRTKKYGVFPVPKQTKKVRRAFLISHVKRPMMGKFDPFAKRTKKGKRFNILGV